jgi:uncharacterized protein YjbI with pentapeptide repeats
MPTKGVGPGRYRIGETKMTTDTATLPMFTAEDLFEDSPETVYLDWAGYNFSALPVATRGGLWSGCDMSNAIAPDTDWSFAVCVAVNFAGADLRGVNFTGADLRQCDFTGADLRGATFDMAILTDATFAGARLPEVDAFARAYVGRRSKAAAIRRTGLTAAIVDHAMATSTELNDRIRAVGAEGIYAPRHDRA